MDNLAALSGFIQKWDYFLLFNVCIWEGAIARMKLSSAGWDEVDEWASWVRFSEMRAKFS
jgi:hypothetical protein